VLPGLGLRRRAFERAPGVRSVITSTDLRHGARRIHAKTQEKHAAARVARLHTSSCETALDMLFAQEAAESRCWPARAEHVVMPTVLLVDTDSTNRAAYAAALTAVTDRVYTAPTFLLAKSALLEARPAVLVTQVRLSEFNGIHLALWGRGRLPSLRVVIVGQSDPNLETEARTSGFFYLRHSDEQAIVQATLEAIAREHPRRRWQRKQLPSSLAGQIDGTPALVLDVGYGGVRMQIQGPFHAEPDTRLPLNIPALGFDVETTCRWITSDESGSYSCGVSLADADVHAGSRWRALVDALPATL